MGMDDNARSGPACSFCGAGAGSVDHLIAGPGVWICDGCVRASYEIIESLAAERSGEDPAIGTASSAAEVDRAALSVDDPVMAEIAQVQQLALRGERSRAADAYAQLWEQVVGGRPLYRITVAHYLADLQDDPGDELKWDVLALDAAAEVDEGHQDAVAVAPLRASLHVNAAAAMAKLGRSSDARRQLLAAEHNEQFLPSGGYGRLVRSQMRSLRAALDGARSEAEVRGQR